MVALLLATSCMAERSGWGSAAVLAIILAGHVAPVGAEEASAPVRGMTRPEHRWTLVQVLDVRRWAGRALRAVGAPSDASGAQPEAVVARAAWGCEE
jgi:hypothetical protein